MMPVPMVSYDQYGPVVSHFICPDLRNAMVLLMILLTSHDADTRSNGVMTREIMLHFSFIVFT